VVLPRPDAIFFGTISLNLLLKTILFKTKILKGARKKNTAQHGQKQGGLTAVDDGGFAPLPPDQGLRPWTPKSATRGSLRLQHRAVNGL
jgi:hypothetical protein